LRSICGHVVWANASVTDDDPEGKCRGCSAGDHVEEPGAGREAQAVAHVAAAEEHWGKLAADGRCSTPEWYFQSEGWSFWIVKGERQSLLDVMAEDATAEMLTRGMFVMDGWQYRLAASGDGAAAFMGTDAAGAGLGYL
jgi:hypothetical protein